MNAPNPFAIDKADTNNSRVKIERIIVRKLISGLAECGWVLHAVNNGEDWVNVGIGRKINTPARLEEEIFAADECHLKFAKDGHSHWVYLVYGNEPYCVVSDYSFSEGDTDGFDALIRAHGEWAEAQPGSGA